MSTTENKTPIGFDMELTDEQLKDVAGGSTVCAKYNCPQHGLFVLNFNRKPTFHAECPICHNKSCSLVSSTMSL